MDVDALKQKAKDALNSDKGEELSDKGLDAVSSAVGKAAGGAFGDQISAARDAVDQRIGKQD